MSILNYQRMILHHNAVLRWVANLTGTYAIAPQRSHGQERGVVRRLVLACCLLVSANKRKSRNPRMPKCDLKCNNNNKKYH